LCSTSKDGTCEGVRGEEDGYVLAGCFSFGFGGSQILNSETGYFILISYFSSVPPRNSSALMFHGARRPFCSIQLHFVTL
jgi:hypothetical protein